MKYFFKTITILLLGLVLAIVFLTISFDEKDLSAAGIDEINSDPGYIVPGNSRLESGDRIWFYNVSGGEFGSDMILVESNGHFGLIDSGNRYQDTIEDEDGTLYDLPYEGQLSCQSEGKNGKDGMIYMVENLGVDHLDFIISTHPHSDHIGGIPEIAELKVLGEDGSTYSLIDSSTVYFYKQYKHINETEDDIVGGSGSSWHNQAFDYQARKAVEERGAVSVEVSSDLRDGNYSESSDTDVSLNETKISDIHYDSGTPSDIDDKLSFIWENMAIDLYNISMVETDRDSNVNSLVTVITIGEDSMYFGGDLNVLEQREQQIAEVVFEDHGTIDLVKASHHGNDFSNSKRLIDLFKPAVIVNTSGRASIYDDAPSMSCRTMQYYAERNCGTAFYEVGASDKMLLTYFEDGVIKVKEVIGGDADFSVISSDNCRDNVSLDNGWNGWYQNYRTPEAAIWYYSRNGVPVTGWQRIKGEWYLFGEDGIMHFSEWISDEFGDSWIKGTGLLAENEWAIIDGNWYYFKHNGYKAKDGIFEIQGSKYYLDENGIMQTGWQLIDDSWYYFDATGAMKTGWLYQNGTWYYLDQSGAMKTGWLYQNGTWYYLDQSGAMKTGWLYQKGTWYYLDQSGAMRTGWQKISGKDYFLKASGAMAANEWVNGYWWLGSDGAWTYKYRGSWRMSGNRWWFADDSGWYAKNCAIIINGVEYSFDSAGWMM